MKGHAIIHLVKVVCGLEQPNTQTTAPEREALKKYASGAGTAIEIGVYEGINTAVISQALVGDGKTFGIDPFFKGSMGICYHKVITKLYLKRKRVSKNVVLIEKFSSDAVGDVPPKVDFIFIDGDHSYDGISKDWRLYADKVRPGGIMALHDTSTIDADAGYIQDSVRFYNDVIRLDDRYEWLETVDRMNVLRKKGCGE
jgi:predicted O-methyltransferase YrrM